MAEFRPDRSDVGRVKWMAYRCMFFCRAAKDPTISQSMAVHYQKAAEEWSGKAFALAYEISARNQERTK